jgi:ribosome-binding protein aMBF1 (putative translation factor)
MDRENIRITIGKNIRHRRMWLGHSEEIVAAHLAIKIKRLQKYESGADSPTCDELIEMARFFKCSVDDLCREAP